MEDHQLFKGNLAIGNNENLYFQQLQNEANSQSLDHSYDSLDTNASESSSSSPHLSHESRNLALPAVTKSVRPVDAASPAHWTYSASGNHIQGRIIHNLNSYDQNLSWNSQTQNEIVDSFQLPCFDQLNENRTKMTSGALHKLDSFTKVFARQNLRNPSASQGLHEQPSLMDSDSALRQLLSVKLGAEQSSLTATMDRYQQTQPNLPNTPQKHQMQAMQHPQQHFFYEYPQHVSQLQSESLMQQGQQYLQQIQSHQLLPQQAQQSHYYIQDAQSGQQRASSQEMQQQRQFSGQVPQYYHSQAARPELHHTMQSLHHHMQMQPASYHRDCNQKTEYYQQDQTQTMQLIQLGSVPQYAYQHSQPFRHTYKQNLVPQQQSLHQDSSQQKSYESQSQVVMESAVGFTNVDTVDNYNNHDVDGIGNTVSQHAALPQDSSFMVNSRGPHPSSTAAWPQVLSDVTLPTVSPDHRGLYSEREDSKNRLTCSMCFKEFKSLPALNGHLRSHGGVRHSNLKQEIISKLHQSRSKSGNSDSLKPQQEKRKYRHRPEPLFIPPPSFIGNSFYSGATLYQSQLRSPRVLGENLLAGVQELPTYTPPPMLSPVRQGSGLFSSVITAIHNTHLPLTPLTPSPRVLLGRPYSIDAGSTTVTPGPGEQTVDVEPRINIGSRFQADIPELQGPSSLEKETDNATLVWTPLPDLENRESQQRVDIFLSMSCSSVLPGGGTNLEYALHLLYECKGNITRALETLLLRNPHRLHNHPLANYHYAGSDKWNATEKKNFNKAVNTCNKDFFHVQKMIKSKTVSQCVEYYYTWKKILHLGRRHRTRLAEVNEDGMTSADDDVDENEGLEDKIYESGCDLMAKSPDLRHATDLPRPAGAYSVSPIGSFVCEMGNCGAIFSSRQALNGHARIHGGTSAPSKVFPVPGSTRTKSNIQSGYCSVKSSPAHSNTSGETDTSTIFPCKVCGKVFFKIKSRNAHMKTHRQQEEQQRQKAQKADVAAKMADTIARTIVRTTVSAEHILPFDHLSLVKSMEQDFDNDVAQDLEDVLEDTDIIHADLLLDDEDTDLLQDGAVL
ncbi:transcriptional-regulating factor 1 isoform X2 [Xenopus laevis]|uniref:Transcriptional-regulating factor 1 isoform X2 n=1 Tax=Xenopus laevis TaxID=8355 RepID=A0A8J1KSA0_XENLA|nr:transcriptional-regulating factor 1 isoform X2 [Xenopus laevis]